jgi:hypothetical protein
MLFSDLDAVPTSMASRSIIVQCAHRPEVRAVDFRQALRVPLR